jgi:hypothetical protein
VQGTATSTAALVAEASSPVVNGAANWQPDPKGFGIEVLEQCPVLVREPGNAENFKFVRCGVCGIHTNRVHGSVLNGIHGVAAHMFQAHKDVAEKEKVKYTFQYVYDNCTTTYPMAELQAVLRQALANTTGVRPYQASESKGKRKAEASEESENPRRKVQKGSVEDASSSRTSQMNLRSKASNSKVAGAKRGREEDPEPSRTAQEDDAPTSKRRC